MSLSGMVLCAVAVAIFKLAALGVDCFQAFLTGLDQLLPIKYGTLYASVNAVFLLFMLIADRPWRQVPAIVGFGTVITAFFMGPLIDYFNRKVAIPMLNKAKA